MPHELVALLEDRSDLEFQYGEAGYLRVWAARRCAEFFNGYRFAFYLPNAIPVGDNGRGRVLVYASGDHGPGVYLASLADLDPEELLWIAPDLEAKLTRGSVSNE